MLIVFECEKDVTSSTKRPSKKLSNICQKHLEVKNKKAYLCTRFPKEVSTLKSRTGAGNGRSKALSKTKRLNKCFP